MAGSTQDADGKLIAIAPANKHGAGRAGPDRIEAQQAGWSDLNGIVDVERLSDIDGGDARENAEGDTWEMVAELFVGGQGLGRRRGRCRC